MNKIYVEVPITTNQTTLSIPCGDDESLWHFTVIFNENEYLHKRLVTVMDNFDDGENPAVQSMLVTNENNRTATFEYHMDKDVNVIDGPEAKELFEKLITKRSNKKK